MTEHDLLMRKIAVEVQWRLPPIVFASAISHGGRFAAEKLKAMGQRAGIADWLISAPKLRGWIEIKTGAGSLRADQIVFRDTVVANGEQFGVARSVFQFFAHLREWGIPVCDERPKGKIEDELPAF